MSKEPTYIEYAGGIKVDIMNTNDPILIDEMIKIDSDSNKNEIKSILKERSDKLISKLESIRGKVKDTIVVISGPEKNELTKVIGPVYEDIENCKTKEKYIRYARNVEFVNQ